MRPRKRTKNFIYSADPPVSRAITSSQTSETFLLMMEMTFYRPTLVGAALGHGFFGQAAFALAVCSFTFVISKLIYRIYLHPLSRFPGPLLAGATNLYSAYYDVVKQGDMIRQLPQLHEKYGPVIRIRPDELHVFDFDSYNE